MKCGTTSLYEYLKQHPDIFMSDVKEPELFFEENSHLIRDGICKSKEDILSLMMKGYKCQKIVGDSSSSYTKFPMFPRCKDIPSKIKSVCKNPKFIYIIRNPLYRLVSEYKFYVRRLGVNGSFKDHLRWRGKVCLPISLYFFQLSNYLKYFDKSCFKVIIFEEFVSNPLDTLKDIFKFLELDSTKYGLGEFKVYNKSPRSQDELKFDKESYDNIIKPIKEDVDQMEKFLGRSLDLWDLSEERWVKKDKA